MGGISPVQSRISLITSTQKMDTTLNKSLHPPFSFFNPLWGGYLSPLQTLSFLERRVDRLILVGARMVGRWKHYSFTRKGSGFKGAKRLLLRATARYFPRWPRKKKFSFWPFNRSFIDQACLVKNAVNCFYSSVDWVIAFEKLTTREKTSRWFITRRLLSLTRAFHYRA